MVLMRVNLVLFMGMHLNNYCVGGSGGEDGK